MGKATGFMEYERRDPGYRPVAERVKDFNAVELRLGESELIEQAARCMDCGTPFCHGCGCPIENVIPEFNEHVYQGRWWQALDILLEKDNFPEFTGRICPALCEGSCVLGINNEPVSIRQIELAIIEKGFESGYIKPVPPPFRRNERIAVLGSGPAGLTVADTLNHAGYRVVVYDEGTKPGGILRYGIPDFKLEKWVVDRRIELMEAEGVVFENMTRMGDDISRYYLQHRFDAVCFAGGAREARDIKVPGRELKGIHFAMDFLVQQNKRLGGELIEPGTEILAAGRNVLVIGGGDTGADCVGTSIRQGAKSVTQFEILPEPPPVRSASTPWPMWPLKLRTSSSHGEGCTRYWSVTTKEFIGSDGAVQAVRAVEVDRVDPGDCGNPTFVEKPASEFVLETDLVLLAMGFSGPGQNKIVEDFAIKTEPNGMVWRDTHNMTNIPGIFVAGDMAQGASLVVRAMRDGRKTAQGIMAYFESMLQQDTSPKPGDMKE
jgi:glutamate synthase (NADPH) small chain